MMHNRVTGSTECLEVVQRVIACAPVAAASRATTVHVMHGEVVIRAAPLTLEAVSFQRLLSVAAEVKVIACLAKVAVKTFLWHLRHRTAYVRRLLSRGTIGASYLRSAAINKINPAIGALAGRAKDLNVGCPSIPGQSLLIVSGANDWNTRRTNLLAGAGWFVRNAALRANAIPQSVARFPVGFQRARDTSFCVGGLLYHLFAADRTDEGSVRSRCHGPSYAGGSEIV